MNADPLTAREAKEITLKANGCESIRTVYKQIRLAAFAGKSRISIHNSRYNFEWTTNLCDVNNFKVEYGQDYVYISWPYYK